MKIKEPKRPPKVRCVRGHKLAEVGYSVALGGHRGNRYSTRRCNACKREDLYWCRQRKKEAARRAAL